MPIRDVVYQGSIHSYLADIDGYSMIIVDADGDGAIEEVIASAANAPDFWMDPQYVGEAQALVTQFRQELPDELGAFRRRMLTSTIERWDESVCMPGKKLGVFTTPAILKMRKKETIRQLGDAPQTDRLVFRTRKNVSVEISASRLIVLPSPPTKPPALYPDLIEPADACTRFDSLRQGVEEFLKIFD